MAEADDDRDDRRVRRLIERAQRTGQLAPKDAFRVCPHRLALFPPGTKADLNCKPDLIVAALGFSPADFSDADLDRIVDGLDDGMTVIVISNKEAIIAYAKQRLGEYLALNRAEEWVPPTIH